MFSLQRKSKTADVDISIHHLKITALEIKKKEKWRKKPEVDTKIFMMGDVKQNKKKRIIM